MSSSSPLAFQKMNGLGNEIVVLDLRRSGTPVTPDLVTMAIRAVRFDQLMVVLDGKSPGVEGFVRIFNQDGSEAEACGNGMRCVGWAEFKAAGLRHMTFETVAGMLDVHVEGVGDITVGMGRPRFGWEDIPLAERFVDTRAIELQIGPIDAPVLHSPSVVNVGNPHAIFWVDDIMAYDLGRFGPLLENHPIFPERANISLAAVSSKTEIELRTWERGAGLTRACGTAACAAAVCGARKKLTDRAVTVTLPGGKLFIEWAPDDQIFMTGPVEFEYEGSLFVSADIPAIQARA